jgi:hypothetical protein
MTGSTAPLLALLLLLPSAFAHIELVFPPGINSKFNPATPEPSSKSASLPDHDMHIGYPVTEFGRGGGRIGRES